MTYQARGQTLAQPPGNEKDISPVYIVECEGVNNCTDWTFLGPQGIAQWKSGEITNFFVEKVEGENVIINRADPTGASAGLTAVYRGTIHGDRLSGEYVSNWPDHWHNKPGNWYAFLSEGPAELPGVMHFCDINCETLKLENGHYLAVPASNFYDQGGYSDMWTVEKFTRASVILHRTLTLPQKGTFNWTYKGQISREGDTLVNVENPVKAANQPAIVQMAWGSALNTVAGNNAERNSVVTPNNSALTGPTINDTSEPLTWIQVFNKFRSIAPNNQ